MMRDEDKPFTCTRNGASFHIMPRNRTGWIYLGLWLIPALALGLTFEWVMAGGQGGTRETVIATVGFVLLLAVWVAAMIRWMYVRSEIIDVRKLTEEKRKRDRGKS